MIWKQPDAVILRNSPLEVNLRHEIGHCNGWKGDHEGARPWYRTDRFWEAKRGKTDKLATQGPAH